MIFPHLPLLLAFAAQSDSPSPHDLSAWQEIQPGDEERTPQPLTWKAEGDEWLAGEGELLSREDYADYHLQFEVQLPPQGQAGLLLAGRWELHLRDSSKEELSRQSCGALLGQRAPLMDASAAAGTWQRVDVTYSHRAGQDPVVSAWIDDRKVQDQVALREPTARGFREPLLAGGTGQGLLFETPKGEASQELDWGDEFTCAVRFRSTASGTLISKCPTKGKWAPDAKALFLRGGYLVYDIGWIGAVRSARKWNDGEWHTVVLVHEDGEVLMFVDGELEAEEDDFRADDEAEFRLKLGSANDDFGGDYVGDLAAAVFYPEAWGAEDAQAWSEAGEIVLDEEGEDAPAFAWTSPHVHSAHLLRPGDPVPAPLRLRATPGVRLRGLELQPLGDVDHAGLIEGWDTTSFARGEAIYSGLCVACHGADGTKPTNPKARPFATGELQNGADPYSLFATITDGYREMPGNAWLRPDQRYDVIHYLRERFLRDKNPSQFVRVDEAYLNSLPKGRSAADEGEAGELVRRDYGPVLASQLGDDVGAALTVRLDEDASISYDLQVMGSPAAWTGGFLDLASTHHYQQRGEGRARPGGPLMAGLDAWGWGYGGSLEWDRSKRPPRGPLPKKMLDYHGHYLHGDEVVLSYAIDRREILEVPGVDRTSGLPVITHRLHVGAGTSNLLLSVIGPPAGAGSAEYQLWDDSTLAWPMVACKASDGRFSIAACLSDVGEWDLQGRAAAFILPGSEEDLEFTVLRMSGTSEKEFAGFRALLANWGEREALPSPLTMTQGGPSRWAEELVTRGEQGAAQGSYAVDTLTLPDGNPWNAWLRTSALDFFEDGRAAVCTYGGDVWIVSGIDEGLEELRWRRFAGGLFEPMGLRIRKGEIFVTGRDRITRLQDLNGDGEADFYESFFADPDVSPNFHAFSFDLQTDAEGNFFYAKSGQYTDYDRGGSVLKVSKDGSSWSEYSLGLRTPNGMGMSPDGRPLVSDNQGNWIPASKISLAEPGGFYGVFPAIRTSAPGLRTRADFDPPVLWMPQEFDSSSGGQLYVDDPRFGPLAGRYLHTSFGKGWMFPLVIDREAAIPQAAAWSLPFQFAAGIQRLRVNPADGQVYTVGLSGWQGPSGGADGCLQRVRYTGQDQALLLSAKVTASGVRLEFSHALDEDSAEDLGAYEARRWNYRWARSYGSAHYSLEDPQREGEDEVQVTAARLSEDGRELDLDFATHRPCDQLALAFELRAGAASVEEEVLFTVNSIPGDPPLLRERAECQETVDLPWTTLPGSGPDAPKVVLIAGDEEYRSEECLPALARILSRRLGYHCTVLYSIDPESGDIDPMNQTFTPGLSQLEDADLVVLFTRFREWSDSDMQHFARYVESGRPLFGIRTATHAFDYQRNKQSRYAHYSTGSRQPGWQGGFGRQILGETWVSHHGGHGSQATRGIVETGQADHPILRGVGHVFGPTDVYTVRDLPEDATLLMRGQVVDGMDPEDPPVEGELNEPMMPLIWTRERSVGEGVQRVVTSTLGSAQDFASPGLRLLWVQACAWALDSPVDLSEEDVQLVGEYEPTPFGFDRYRRGVAPSDWALPE